MRVLQSLGRADKVDVAGRKRLVDSICRFLEPYEGKALQPALGPDSPFEFVGARELGVPWLFDALWTRLGIRNFFNRSMMVKKPCLSE